MRVVKKTFNGVVCEQHTLPNGETFNGVTQYVRGVARRFYVPLPRQPARPIYEALRKNQALPPIAQVIEIEV